MKLKWTFLIGVILAGWSVTAIIEGVPIVGIALIAAAVIVFRKSVVKRSDQSNPPQTAPAQQPPLAEAPHGKQSEEKKEERLTQHTLYVPEMINGEHRAYFYENVKIFTPDEIAKKLRYDESLCGQLVTLEAEPSNAYDPKAVIVKWGYQKIGYLYKGKLQDMANDFIADGLPIWCATSSLDPDERIIYISIAFYRGPAPDFDDDEFEDKNLV